LFLSAPTATHAPLLSHSMSLNARSLTFVVSPVFTALHDVPFHSDK
jgi:hypothetical protein